MATFSYRAVGKNGNLVDGSIEGSDDKAIALKLQDMGLIPIEIGAPKSGRALSLNLGWSFSKVSSKDVMFFTQELSTLVNAGLPLDRSLTICKDLSEKPAVRSIVEEILQGIKQGKTFAESLSDIRGFFRSSI
jgi:general secretion pathway protein F